MTKRKPPAPKPAPFFDLHFSWQHVVTVIGWIVLGTIFYESTSLTLKQHEQAIADVKAAMARESQTRDGVRNEFLETSRKTAEGIGALNTIVAVQKAQTDNILAALARISSQLGGGLVMLPPPVPPQQR